jgi:hypothetical protein
MSEKIGLPLYGCRGILEYWNFGILGLKDFYLFLDCLGRGQKNKKGPISAFNSHPSIIP